MKIFLVHKAVNGIKKKQTAEQDQLGKQEQPHSHSSANIISMNMRMCMFVHVYAHLTSCCSTSTSSFLLYSYGPSVIVGISEKFSRVGGVSIVHSRVFPPHMFFSVTSLPFFIDLIRFANMMIKPVIRIHEPIVDVK